MVKTLVLFDVDKTLMTVNGIHARVMNDTFKKFCNYNRPEGKLFDGYTDLQIIYEVLDATGMEKTPRLVNDIIYDMIDGFSKADLRDAHLLDGVLELLKELKKDKNIIIGLVTGNIEEIAYMKLKHFKIDEYFILGGFGHISAVRADLVRDAKKKAEDSYEDIPNSKIFVIGDTIFDIKAAKDSKTVSIAVSTGDYTYEELAEKNPDYIFKDLTDTKRIIDVIKNARR